MPKPGEIRYCPELGGQETNAAFVWIPPGSFWMGDKLQEEWDMRQKKNPVHYVSITKGFWLQQTPLTEVQYTECWGSNQLGCNFSWNDVIYFCRNKPLRMPTEAEWEYAARSNTGHKYVWAGSNVAYNVAWTDYNSKFDLKKLGQIKANSYGLFAMSGFAREWCSDWDSIISHSPQINPTVSHPGSFRITRSSSWDYDRQSAKIASRNIAHLTAKSDDLGVRLIWETQHD